MARAAWFERKFDFALPLEILPDLRDRLRATPARLAEALRGHSPAALTAKPEGKWSAQEHAGHLTDLEPLWLARVNDYIVGTHLLTPADLTNRKTEEANHNARPLREILADFRAGRDKLLRSVAALDHAAFRHTILHPRLEVPMRLVDHLYFVAEHDDHHLARIEELLEAQAPKP
jgi:uncharacterized damage-inducible protein DinB